MASSRVAPVSEGIREQESACFPTPAQLFALFVAYFTLQMLIRTFLSSSVDLDESEQMMLTQKFSWGYGTDPPVYTWIQMGFFAVLGRTVLALALWKNLLLLATYGFVYASARWLTRSHRCGAVAALSLLFMPHMVWESQRDLTHTVLACACATATLFCLFRAHETRSARCYVALGVAIGLGLLSKFNFGLWAAGLLLGGLSVREYRRTVLTRWMVLALVLGVGIAVPNWLWCLSHRELALYNSAKLGVQEGQTWLATVWLGLGHLVQAILAFIGPPGLVYALLFWKSPKMPTGLSAPPPGAKLLWRAFLSILALMVLLVVGFRATGFRERWFQPMLVCAPVLAVTWLRERVNAERLRWMTGWGVSVMVGVALCIPGRIVFMERLKREEPLGRPYAQLARELAPDLPPGTLLVSDTMILGANLQLALPEHRAATPELAKLLGEGAPHCAIVWDANHRDVPSKFLSHWAESVVAGNAARMQPHYYTATYKFHHTRQFRLGMTLLY